MRLAAAASLLCLAGCMRTMPPEAFADGTPELRPEAFFAGHTTSFGLIEDSGGTPTRRFRVEGRGVRTGDDLILDQTISMDGEVPTTRRWVMHAHTQHGMSATLTDASGPVRGETYGNLMHLRYSTKSPPFGTMEQWLYLQPDGVTVMNEATVRVLGLDVAHVSERITHSDD